MNTEVSPFATSGWNIVFIIIWNIVGELVSPKNMTVGSNSPSGVRNAAFHSSSGFDLDVIVSPSNIKFGEQSTPC